MPTPTKLALSGIVDVDLAEAGGCALDVNGTVYCWGSNRSKRFHDGGFPEPFREPQAMADLSPATSVALGGDHVCVLRADGTVWCRGLSIQRGFYGDAPTDEATEMHFPFGDP